ncbi:MAG: GTPase, partial [Pseudomonadota bacterium]
PLLLACSKPNQLRQHDIMGAFRAFREWCGFVELQDPELGEGLFAVDMQSDQPPIFSELLVRRGTSQFRFLNTKALIAHLEGLRHSRGTQGLRVIEFDRQTRLDTNLLEHLIKSLGEISQRNFARQPARTTLDIAAGLSNVHYFVAGERTLDDVFHGVEYDAPASERIGANPFLVQDQRADQWRQVAPEADLDVDVARRSDDSHVPVDIERLTHAATQQDRDSREPTRYVVHSVKTMNASAGGYCVEWDEPPDSIHIGDIVCVREADNQRANWTIAVIRWVSQIKHAPTLLGLELISPRGTAYAARIKMPSGEYSRPIRVILLPEIALVGQSHTLILPRLVFKEGQRITLSREEDAFLVKLKRQVASTGYFSQMDFDYLRQLDEDIAASRGDSLPTAVFDSIWSEL